MALCATCGSENPAAARFCMACGGSVEVPCSSCGTELPPGARFCFSCGHELELGATAADEGQPAMVVTNHVADACQRAGLTEAAARTRQRLSETIADVVARIDDQDRRRGFVRSNAVVG